VLRSAFLCLTLSGCGLVGWLQEPVGQAPIRECNCTQPSAGTVGGHVSPLGIEDGAPAVVQRKPAQTRGAILIDDATTVGGILTGNPFAWGLAGQIAHLVFGTAAGAVRRRKGAS